MKKVIWLLLACASVSVSAAQQRARSVELYKFENEDGVVVLAHSIPPELVYKGYTVVNPDGTVLRVVPRQLTPKEIEERDRKEAEEKAAEASRVAQAHNDEELTKLYASTNDIIEARDRKLQSIDGVIATTKANIVRLKQQKQHLEEQAAQRERDGLLPSPEILQNLQILTTQIGDKEREVETREMEKEQTSEQFQRDLARFQELFGPPPTAPANDAEKAPVAVSASDPAKAPVAASAKKN